MVSQLLYGEHIKVLERRKTWSRIRVAYDSQEGWVHNNQISFISEDVFNALVTSKNTSFSSNLVSHIRAANGILKPIVLGSVVSSSTVLKHTFEGDKVSGELPKSSLIETALMYTEAPYQWGGKTPFGIDAPGLTQMVYKINGYSLHRSAEAQSKQGVPLSFIEESEPGDLAFFDNKEGIIDHVGVILEDNYIIHAHGHVRIDRLDHTGIFNVDERLYSHQLRVIKKII